MEASISGRKCNMNLSSWVRPMASPLLHTASKKGAVGTVGLSVLGKSPVYKVVVQLFHISAPHHHPLHQLSCLPLLLFLPITFSLYPSMYLLPMFLLISSPSCCHSSCLHLPTDPPPLSHHLLILLIYTTSSFAIYKAGARVWFDFSLKRAITLSTTTYSSFLFTLVLHSTIYFLLNLLDFFTFNVLMQDVSDIKPIDIQF